MLVACPSHRGIDLEQKVREHHLLGHTHPGNFHQAEDGEGEKEWAMAQIPQILIVLTNFQYCFLSKCFSICYMPLGQFPDTLNNWVFKKQPLPDLPFSLVSQSMELLALTFNFLMNCQIFFQSVCSMLQSHQSQFLYIPSQSLVSLFNFSHSSWCVVITACVFNLSFLMTHDVGHLFTCLLVIRIYSFVYIHTTQVHW